MADVGCWTSLDEAHAEKNLIINSFVKSKKSGMNVFKVGKNMSPDLVDDVIKNVLLASRYWAHFSWLNLAMKPVSWLIFLLAFTKYENSEMTSNI